MAQKVQVLLVDDIDGGDADETVEFALDGTRYEIDLSSGNASKLRDTLAPYVAEARKASNGRRRPSGSSGGGRKAAASGDSPAAIRAWARENGYDVPDRGRVSTEVREAYAAAH